MNVNWFVVRKFPMDADLSAVSGFLHQRSVVHKIYEEAGEQVVAVADPRMIEPLQQFLQDLTQGKFEIAAESVPAEPVISVPPSFFQQISQVPITALLIALSAIGALLVGVDNDFVVVRWLTFQGIEQDQFVPWTTALQQGEWWRLITPVFLHFSFLHFLFNGLWTWELGRRLEYLMGPVRYSLFFVFTAVFSNVLQFVWSGPVLFGGMSGVIYGLIGFILIRHKLSPHRLTAVSPSVLGFMLFWLVLCMTGAVNYLIGSSVANAAHVGGLIAGCVFALIRFKPKFA